MTIDTTTITQDQFYIEFQPLPNVLDEDASWEGCLYETFGEERDYVYSIDPHYVWTLIEEEGVEYIVSGRRFVNRLGYVITVRPWSEGTYYFVLLETEKGDGDADQ